MPEAINLQGVGLAGVPHLDQYFGVWAMEADRFGAMLNGRTRMDLSAHIAQRIPLQAAAGGGPGRGGAGYEMLDGGAAVIEMVGPQFSQFIIYLRRVQLTESVKDLCSNATRCSLSTSE